ncbi:hypothetical protein DFS34DRAFT_113549 [Phlyctochytrium arcticum]|nr:hypothetical protein DFS34DRAFT_113549 [Phlyctochytrium arcticum]
MTFVPSVAENHKGASTAADGGWISARKRPKLRQSVLWSRPILQTARPKLGNWSNSVDSHEKAQSRIDVFFGRGESRKEKRDARTSHLEWADEDVLKENRNDNHLDINLHEQEFVRNDSPMIFPYTPELNGGHGDEKSSEDLNINKLHPCLDLEEEEVPHTATLDCPWKHPSFFQEDILPGLDGLPPTPSVHDCLDDPANLEFEARMETNDACKADANDIDARNTCGPNSSVASLVSSDLNQGYSGEIREDRTGSGADYTAAKDEEDPGQTSTLDCVWKHPSFFQDSISTANSSSHLPFPAPDGEDETFTTRSARQEETKHEREYLQTVSSPYRRVAMEDDPLLASPSPSPHILPLSMPDSPSEFNLSDDSCSEILEQGIAESPYMERSGRIDSKRVSVHNSGDVGASAAMLHEHMQLVNRESSQPRSSLETIQSPVLASCAFHTPNHPDSSTQIVEVDLGPHPLLESPIRIRKVRRPTPCSNNISSMTCSVDSRDAETQLISSICDDPQSGDCGSHLPPSDLPVFNYPHAVALTPLAPLPSLVVCPRSPGLGPPSPSLNFSSTKADSPSPNHSPEDNDTKPSTQLSDIHPARSPTTFPHPAHPILNLPFPTARPLTPLPTLLSLVAYPGPASVAPPTFPSLLSSLEESDD